jgi:hypothetical protein
MVAILPRMKSHRRYNRPLPAHFGYVKYDIGRRIFGNAVSDKNRPMPTNRDRFRAVARGGQDFFTQCHWNTDYFSSVQEAAAATGFPGKSCFRGCFNAKDRGLVLTISSTMKSCLFFGVN